MPDAGQKEFAGSSVISPGLESYLAPHKLARLIYAMLTKGEEYTDQGQDYYEERYRQQVLHNLSQRANKLGMRLVVADVA